MIKGVQIETQLFDYSSHGGIRKKSKGSKHPVMMIKGIKGATQAFDPPPYGMRDKNQG